MRAADAIEYLKYFRAAISASGKTGAILAACLLLSCASSSTAARPPCETVTLDVRVPEFEGARQGLVRGIVGAPEEMLDTAVRNAGIFDGAEARLLKEVLLEESRAAGFCGEGGQPPVALRVRVLTHLARVGEFWPGAEYLVEAEYAAGGSPPRQAYMYYDAWFYWSMDSLRHDVMKSLAGKILRDVALGMDGGIAPKEEYRGRARFFTTAAGAREEFFGE